MLKGMFPLTLLITLSLVCPGIAQLNPSPPSQPVKLVFIHHSVGEDWLREGELLQALNDNNYYVTDTNYDWGPPDQDVQDGHPIGYHTDIGHWYNWFLGPHKDTYLQALYTNSHLTPGLQNSIQDPGGENTIVMFKSCFTSGQVIYGNPDDPPLPRGVQNPLWGIGVCDDQACSGSVHYTVSNIKGLYRDLLDYFATRQDKLFILITTPPSLESAIGDPALAAKLRAINNWLVNEWLSDYPYNNVFVFDYYNVLTSNGGDPNTNDAGADTGNHHRYNPTTGQIEHIINLNNDFLAYGTDSDGDGVPDDNHPTPAGHRKATIEFIPLLNIAYNRWRASAPVGQLSVSPQNVDFGDVNVGDTSPSQVITVTNEGNSPVTLGDISLTGADADQFAIQQDNCSGATLDPSESRTVTVVFQPTSPGSKTATLQHTGTPPFTVTLTGNGVGGGPPPGGNVYYVSPNGDDSNPGTLDRPWATPGYGSRRLQPGDTLIILGGRYVLSRYPDDIIAPPSGRPDAWVTIKGEEGNRPVLVGRDNLLTAIDLSGRSYVRIENLEITSDDQASGQARYFRDGIEIIGSPASHIVLKDLYIHHLDEFGVNIQDIDDLQILGCRIEYCGFGAVGGPEGEAGGWRSVLIRGCSLSYSGHYYQGVPDNPNNPYERPDGFGIEPSDGPIEIADCVVEHNKGDGLDSKARNTYIHNCIVANNSCDGVKLWGGGSRVENTLIYGRGDGNPTVIPWSPIVISSETPDATFEIVNVTVDDALGENYLMHVQYDYPDTPVRVTLRNSILCGRGNNSPIFIGRASALTAEHNLFYLPNSAFVLTHGDTTYTSANISLLGSGNIYGDPLFVSPAWGTEGDYHLQPNSPAIDAGMSGLGIPAFDLEGIPRSLGNAPDIGAYEYRSTPISDLEITKEDSPDPVIRGGRLIYTLTVVNRGPDPVEYADVRDDLPDGVVFANATASSGTAGYDRQSHSISWHIPRLEAGQQAALTITVEVPQNLDPNLDVLLNTAVVTPATTSLDPNDQNNTISEETTIRSAPNIVVSPSTLDFGSVFIGEAKELSLVVSNDGLNDLNIGRISIAGTNASEFRIVRDDCSDRTIPPGESRQVRVEFHPESPGAKEAVLRIPSDDPETPLLEVELRGKGLLFGDVSGDGNITAYDASKILRYVVRRENLTEEQLAAADVSGNGEVSPYDAARILQFVVGLIESLKPGEGAPSMNPAPRVVFIPSLKARLGERVLIPVLVDNPSGVISGEMTGRFDREALRFIGARSGFELESKVEGDTLKLAFAGYKPRRSRELVHLEFEVVDDSTDHAVLKLEKVRLNEGMKVKLSDGMVELIPIRTELLQNYPNPFNAETWIPFKLAEGAEVEIRIYDSMGRLVRELELGMREAGSYTTRGRAACWDGRNGLGEEVSSGVYIYQLRAGRRTFVRKMVILK